MRFDCDTDRAGRGGDTFACSLLLDFPGVADTSCVWSSDALVIATLETSDIVVPGDALATRAGVLNNFCAYSNCACWRAANATNGTIAAPKASDTPAALIIGPVTVGSCSDLALDGSGSTGSGGRAWAVAIWNITSAYVDVHLGRGGVGANATSGTIAAPVAPDTPAAVIFGPATVGSCSDLALDGSGSTGSGGRAWAVAIWNVTSSDADVH